VKWHRFASRKRVKSSRPEFRQDSRAQLTLGRQSETLRPDNRHMVGVMKRIGKVALSVALAGFLLPAAAAQAQTAPAGVRIAQASPPVAADASSQRRRPARRLPIFRSNQWEPDVYPRYNPGPNAVRDCTATYVQEYRPSGTVITPRMNCYWRPG
jgi:hypothetical protein